MTTIEYGAIDLWPGALTPYRLPSPFGADWSKTLDLLDREAHMLGASTVTIRRAVRPADVLRDGSGMKANGRAPEHPGVVVVLDTKKHGVLTYATDRFTTWHANVRAVALALEALRKIERYGVADRGEQYAGFAAIGTGIAMGSKRQPLTLEGAAAILAGALDSPGHASTILVDWSLARTAYRAGVKRLHPDSTADVEDDETREKLALLQEAWELVERHHRVSA